MGYNPFNLALRFVLELVALYFIGRWGWVKYDGILRFALAMGLPLIAAAVWGVFRVPDDGGAPVVRVPGIVRLSIEALYFGFAIWGLFDMGATTTAWIFGAIVLLHYLISYDRIFRVLKQ
jgi:hypothetical protein